jgi:hypothetical protein
LHKVIYFYSRLIILSPLKSRILSSAKRPLFLSWLNTLEYADFHEKHHQLIFKNGDGLNFLPIIEKVQIKTRCVSNITVCCPH